MPIKDVERLCKAASEPRSTVLLRLPANTGRVRAESGAENEPKRSVDEQVFALWLQLEMLEHSVDCRGSFFGKFYSLGFVLLC